MTQGQEAQPPAPENTVNIAEYQGLIAGLRAYLAAGGAGPLQVQGDSQLIIYQMEGRYGVRQPTLAALHATAQALCAQIAGGVSWRWMRRSENTAADLLARGVDPAAPSVRTLLTPEAALGPLPPPLQAAIARLNDHPAPGFGDLARLRVGGRDALSEWTLPQLQACAGAPAAATVQAAFPDAPSTQAAVLRWALRGLALELAMQKGRVDLEIQARAHATSPRPPAVTPH
jgi:ribonuclease HI